MREKSGASPADSPLDVVDFAARFGVVVASVVVADGCGVNSRVDELVADRRRFDAAAISAGLETSSKIGRASCKERV